MEDYPYKSPAVSYTIMIYCYNINYDDIITERNSEPPQSKSF